MHGKHISKTFWADIYGVHTVPMVPKHVCMLHWLRCCNFHYTWCGILLKGFLYKFFVSFEMRHLQIYRIVSLKNSSYFSNYVYLNNIIRKEPLIFWMFFKSTIPRCKWRKCHSWRLFVTQYLPYFRENVVKNEY